MEIQKLSTEIFDMILKRKEKYHHHLSLKLNNPNTSAKTWSILKPFYNDTKFPLIPPLLAIHKIVSDFTKKANLFKDLFAALCTPLTNSSVLPSAIYFKTHSKLTIQDFF